MHKLRTASFTGSDVPLTFQKRLGAGTMMSGLHESTAGKLEEKRKISRRKESSRVEGNSETASKPCVFAVQFEGK